MPRVAYLFERFPSFGQTFCYREVAELIRQGMEVSIFSIRQVAGEPPQDWAKRIVQRVAYLPEERDLVAEIEQAAGAGELSPEAVRMLKEWGRQSDFLRLYQAAYVGMRLRAQGIERVHAHFAGMAARTAYWIREFYGIDYSLTVHANDIFAPRDFVVSLGKLFQSAVAIVTVSDFAVEYLRTRFPAEAGKIQRVYNGVDLGRFQAAEFRSSVPLIISVGRLIEKKGFRDLIAACERLKSTSFRCEIIGEGPLQTALSVQIAAGRLEEEVLLLGPRSQSQIVERLAAANVFVLPCVAEADGGMDNLPTVIMEAMASGLPVISTALSGIPEMVQPGETGILVAPNDSAALAAAIARLISQPAEARRLGARGRELAEEKFSIETNVQSLAAILRQG
jgi:colanic acid/amylovoran biosynthesis glycosyltransferase